MTDASDVRVTKAGSVRFEDGHFTFSGWAFDFAGKPYDYRVAGALAFDHLIAACQRARDECATARLRRSAFARFSQEDVDLIFPAGADVEIIDTTKQEQTGET